MTPDARRSHEEIIDRLRCVSNPPEGLVDLNEGPTIELLKSMVPYTHSTPRRRLTKSSPKARDGVNAPHGGPS